MTIDELIKEVEKIPALIERIEALEKENVDLKFRTTPPEEYMPLIYFIKKHNTTSTTLRKVRNQNRVQEDWRLGTLYLNTVQWKKQ